MNSVKRKKFKYGSLAVGLTAAVVAFIIILNAVFYALATHFFWYFDMTSGQIYQLSEKSTQYLDKINEDENKIVIYFFTDKDNLGMSVSSSNYMQQTTLWGMKPIHELSLQLEDRYDFISVEYLNITSDPDKIKSIVGDDYYATTSFSTRHVLIVNYTYERNADGSILRGPDGKPIEYIDYKLCARNSFYLFNYSAAVNSALGTQMNYVNAFRGDYYFTSAIMALTKIDKPDVYFLCGHSEAIGNLSDESASSYGDALALYYMFEELGCNIRKIDLKYDSFDEDAKNSIVVIYGPQRDITAASTTTGINETDKLKAFLDKKGNSMMVFLDSSSVQLTNIEALIKDYTGVTASDNKAKDSGEASVSTDGYSIVGKYQNDSASNAYDICNRIGSEGMADKVIFKNALPLSFDNSADNTGSVIILPESSGAKDHGENASLLTVSKLENDGELIVCGSVDFAGSEMLESDIYGNKNLLLSVLSDMNVGDVPMNIGVKVIRSEGLDRTELEARNWTILISAVIPACVAVLGTVVYLRRKHS